MIFSRTFQKRLLLLVAILLALSVAIAIFSPLVLEAQERGRPNNCSGGMWSPSTYSPTCLFTNLVALISASLIYVAVWILTAAGLLFNLLIDHTIINFGQFFYSGGVQLAIETAWTAFRDIANILIIGMFVFIAISIILGVESFGNNRLVANVLIIAVLINFSLIFTKVIIDFSNFTAFQFYNAASFQAGNADSTGVNAGFGQKGIAGSFIHFLGVSGFGDTVDAVRQTAAANDSVPIALLHGIMSAVFLLGAAAVLFYGSFLLASRAILLIFLLLTSSLAFASYLLPKGVLDKFGFKVWWVSLLKAAVFAPLLMLFLWVTLAVSAGMKANIGTVGAAPVTLGTVLTNPTTPGGMEVLFMYFIVLGLLFVSFKVASGFSVGISGFDWASVLPASIVGAGGAFLGQAGRDILGRRAINWEAKLQARAKGTDSSTYLGRMRANMLDSLAQGAKSLSKSDFNAMRTPLGNTIAKAVKGTGLTAEMLGGGKRTKGELSGAVGDLVRKTEKAEAKFDRSGITPAAKTIREDAAIAAARAEAAARTSKDDLTKAIAASGKKEDHDKATLEVKLAEADVASLMGKQKQQLEDLGKSIRALKNEDRELSVKASDKEITKRRSEIEKEIESNNKKLKMRVDESKKVIAEAHKRADKARWTIDKIEKSALGDFRKTTDKGTTKQSAKQTTKNFTEALSQSMGLGAGEAKIFQDTWQKAANKRSPEYKQRLDQFIQSQKEFGGDTAAKSGESDKPVSGEIKK